jgi:tetratricopeptide (TPR) repeat protein
MHHLKIAFALCALLAATAVFAGGKAPARKGDPKEKAAALYRDGVAAFDVGKYPEALASFTESYNLSGESGLLFNLGVCSEKTGDREKAAAFYSLYLEEMPDAPDAADVRARLDAVRAAPEEKPAEEIAAPPPPPPPPVDVEPAAPPVPEEPVEEDAPKNAHVGPALAMGLGGLVVATGAVTAIMAYKGYGDLDSSCAPNCSSDKVHRVKATAIAADVQLGVGVVAVAVGLTWLLLDLRSEKAERRDGAVEIAALPFGDAAGGGIAVEGRF